MTSSKSTYETPLNSRYASKEMQFLFSPDKKFRTWRRLWIALAESEKELGLPITQEQIDELRRAADDINYEAAEARVMTSWRTYMHTENSARRQSRLSIWGRPPAM